MAFTPFWTRLENRPELRQLVSSGPLAALRGWRYWVVPIGMVAVVALYIDLLLTSPSDPITQRQIVSEAGQVASLFIAVGLCVWASTRAPMGRPRWAWRCFAL